MLLQPLAHRQRRFYRSRVARTESDMSRMAGESRLGKQDGLNYKARESYYTSFGSRTRFGRLISHLLARIRPIRRSA